MASILTNTSAMVALQNLRVINKGLEDTQSMISTGKAISSARDNALFLVRCAQQPHQQKERHHGSHKVRIRHLPGAAVVAARNDFLALDNNGRVGLRGHRTTLP